MRLPGFSVLRGHLSHAVLCGAVLAFTFSFNGCGTHPLSTIRQTPTSSSRVNASALAGAATLSAPTDAPATQTPPASPAAEATSLPLAATETPSAAPVETAAPDDAQATTPAEAEAEATPEAELPQEQLPPPHAVPVRVLVPRIGVDARVIPVGEAPDGSMDSPNNPVDVGWWDLGARPGDQGSPVLGGHVDYAGYGAAVFWNLKLLRAGDQITVVSADDSRWVFTVNEVDTYSYADTSVLDRIFRRTDHQGLNLITCTGTFDPRSHNYDQRVVVYTTLNGS